MQRAVAVKTVDSGKQRHYSAPVANPYHEISHWQQHYAKEDPERVFDWYDEYDGALRELILERVDKQARILMIGCGNSTMSERMHDEGYESIVNTDFVDAVVARMAERCAERPGLTWQVMDARQLGYPDASFDVVIDKGTIDAIDMGPTNVPRVCAEARRVLRPGGLFAVISVQLPIVRTHYFDRPEYGWTVEQLTLKSGASGVPYYCFLMVRP